MFIRVFPLAGAQLPITFFQLSRFSCRLPRSNWPLAGSKCNFSGFNSQLLTAVDRRRQLSQSHWSRVEIGAKYCTAVPTPPKTAVTTSPPGSQSVKNILIRKPFGPCSAAGWVKSLRRQKANTFIDLGDGSTHQHLQIVISTDRLPPDINFHSAVSVEGQLQPSSHPGQEVELLCEGIHLYTSCSPSYPFQPRKHFSQDFVRKQPSCKAKTNGTASLLRLRNSLTQSIHQYFQSQGFIQIHTPILTANDCEGGGEVFRVFSQSDLVSAEEEKPAKTLQHVGAKNWSTLRAAEYFDQPVYLTVSGQLHLEAICNGIAKVYTFNPAFRAERGRTRRHLSEFWMIEAEMAFCHDIHQLLDLMENIIKHTAQELLERMDAELAQYAKSANVSSCAQKRIAATLSSQFPRITFQEAKDLLSSQEGNLGPVGEDLNRDQELFLCHHLGGPVFVYNWPTAGKPFYMRKCLEDPAVVGGVDLLVPGVGELCGGSLREIRPEDITDRLEGVDLEWYLQMRRQGSAPTGGFGLGFERLIQWLVGVENIRDTIPFYRSPHSCHM